ncbi:MAG: FprA family A-type flavoprotein [Deltaproteobacteria bacterium]|nr:FprA family A-type flavoprotein [Deltaproteobacteria bacterium]MBW2334670.1 FprA family A-type flavoprotein [Deltaproteobacteria bacterium]
MSKALIVYATRTGSTKNIAELIAEGIRFTGAEPHVMNANEITNETDLEGFEAYVFGSATYHGEMMQVMKKLLFLAEKINFEGKPGGAFGAYGWSGEASYRIYETMENIFKMDMVSGPLRLKSSGLEGGKQMAQDYGREVGKKFAQ